jgi:5'-nucleotidase
MTSDRPFILGLDLDGVTGDYTGEFRRHVARSLGVAESTLPRPSTWSFADAGWGITSEQYMELHSQAVRNGMFRAMPLMDGASDALWALSNAGVHIRVITHRLIVKQLHNTSVTDTVTWLDTHNIPYRDVCFVADKFHVDADVYIDDAPHNVTALRENGQNVITFDATYNRSLPGARALNWDDAKAQVMALAATRGL